MPHTATGISSPVSIGDVQAVLGHGPATGLLALCASPRINIWSLRKPVVSSVMYDLTDDDLAAANYGFALNSYGSAELLLAALDAGTAWAYQRPDGRWADGNPNAWQPCRLGDFRGYNHAAEPFIVCPGDISLNPDRRSYTFFAAETVTTGLDWKVLGDIAQCYPCVCVFDTDGTLVGYKTANVAFGSNAVIEGDTTAKTVKITVSGTGADMTMSAGQRYRYMLCASTTRKTSMTAAGSAGTQFRPVPALPALTGALAYSSVIDYLDFSIAGVLGDTVIGDGGTYVFEDPYERGYIGPIADTAAYLGLGGAGRLALLIAIANSDTASHSTTYTRIHASCTLVTDTAQDEVPALFSATADGAGGYTLHSHSIASVTVGARSTAYYVMYCPYLMAKNADGYAVALPDGAVASPIMTLEWNDTNAQQPLRALLRVCQGASQTIDLPTI